MPRSSNSGPAILDRLPTTRHFSCALWRTALWSSKVSYSPANFGVKLSRPGFSRLQPGSRAACCIASVTTSRRLQFASRCVQLPGGNRRAARASARQPWPCSLHQEQTLADGAPTGRIITPMSELVSIALTTLLGSGVATAIVGAFFKRRFDRELEYQRAVLERESRVHEQQVMALVKLDKHVRAALGYLEVMSKSVVFRGEDPATYPAKFRDEMAATHEELALARLLLPPSLTEQLERLFKKMFEGQIALSFFYDRSTPDGPERAAHWERAKAIAYQELPVLIAAIEREARVVIHGAAPVS